MAEHQEVGRLIVGVDPGLSGALALYDGWRPLAIADMPTAGGRVLGGDLADQLEDWRPDVVVIEQVNAFRGSAASRAFAFGRSYGCVEGVAEALRLRVETLSPARWKSRMGLGRDKAESRALACRLWPDWRGEFRRVKDDGRAEAALLAEAWCRIERRSVQHSAT